MYAFPTINPIPVNLIKPDNRLQKFLLETGILVGWLVGWLVASTIPNQLRNAQKMIIKLPIGVKRPKGPVFGGLNGRYPNCAYLL
jgi:hypothetical protein